MKPLGKFNTLQFVQSGHSTESVPWDLIRNKTMGFLENYVEEFGLYSLHSEECWRN